MTSTALTSTMVPSLTGTELFVGLFPDRVPYRGGVSASRPGPRSASSSSHSSAPGCPGFIGMFARDLDGDHLIDVVGDRCRPRLHHHAGQGQLRPGLFEADHEHADGLPR
ncbi:MAG: hypothetical protein IPQ07_23580 [Myxococcales bacterium]|nr:hypothetical protein [Myxococcales bacterium]